MDKWKRNFYAIWIAEFLAISGFGTSNTVMAIYLSKDLGIVDPQALQLWTGFIVSGAAVSLAVFAPIWGGLADRRGRKLMLLRAMAGGAVITFLMSFTQAPWQVAILKLVQGCLTGTVAAATTLVASIVPPKETGYRLGILQSAVYLGNFAGPIAGGFITDAFGTRVNFMVTSAMLACAALLTWRLVRENFVPPAQTPKRGLRAVLPDLSPLRSEPRLIALLLVVFAAQFGMSIAGPITQLFVLDLVGAENAGFMTGLISGIASLTAALSSILLGRLSRRIGYEKTLLICLAGAMLVVLPQGLVWSPFLLLGLRAASGFFSGGTMPSVNALIAKLCGRGRQGATYGLSSSVSAAGNAVGPILGTTLSANLGFEAAYLAAGGVFAASAVAVGAALRRSRLKDSEETLREHLPGSELE